MLVWNDLEADEKIKVYDKGVNITSGDKVRELLVNYRSGDMWAPQIEQIEALRVELDYFADCILQDKTPFNDGQAGLRVVRMLEAADRSIKTERRTGTPVNEHCSIAPDVKLGKGVKLSKFINLYGCEDRRRNQNRRVRRNSEERVGRPALQDLQPHLHLRRRDHRGQRLHRTRRDVHQRHLSAGHGQRGTANGSRLESGAHGRQERRIDRLGRHDSGQRHDRRERHRRRRQRGHQERSGKQLSWPEIRRRFCARSNPPWRPSSEHTEWKWQQQRYSVSGPGYAARRTGTGADRGLPADPAHRRIHRRADGGRF